MGFDLRRNNQAKRTVVRFVSLFNGYQLGGLQLRNRVVMAPMTRSRALNNVPTEVMAEYYRQRAQAGLIITEGTAPSPNGLGYPRIPGAYSDAQVEGWRGVTTAVHTAGGRIFIQLMHVGRVGHRHNLPEGAELVAPSAVAAPGEMYTDQAGPQPHPEPRAMIEADITQAVGEFASSARRAVDAGFDGVEIHGANGYLVEQFLNPATNQRTDAYGGAWKDRNRFALEVARKMASAIGPDRIGIRLSPYGVFNAIAVHDELDEQYAALATALNEIGLAYIHLVDHAAMGAPPVPRAIKRIIRERFEGTLILSGGYDRQRAEADLGEGLGDLIAFGRPFIANPDLVDRLRDGLPIAEPKADLFYTPGPQGYTDYPAFGQRS